MSTQDAALPSAPKVEGPAPRVLIVRAPYYRDVIDGLTVGAVRILTEAGATHEILDIAGAAYRAEPLGGASLGVVLVVRA